jgi:UDP-2,3-diacylglucosamine pyrophosphatase LpxH
MSRRSAIESALDRVLNETRTHLISLDVMSDRYVVFSDHHKGQRDGADDFRRNEPAYLAALDHYDDERYTLIVLGDAEELWENRVEPVMQAYSNVLETEQRFHPERLVKIWGNHDDEWAAPRRVDKHLPAVFGHIEVREGLQFSVRRSGAELGRLLMLHGHQGTLFSDRLAGVAKLAVRFVWRTIQRITRLASTTPATDACLRDEHDRAMYRWAGRHSALVLIAGHTHRPVFSSKTHLQQLEEEMELLEQAMRNGSRDAERQRKLTALQSKAADVRRRNEECEEAVTDDEDRSRPCYFNSGCCCFADGDVTGIELAQGEIRLVRWSTQEGPPDRTVLARTDIDRVYTQLGGDGSASQGTG